MRKKLMSCVLALALATSVAMPGFARDVSEGSSVGSKIIGGVLSDDSSGNTVRPNSVTEDEINHIVGRINQVFGYEDGVMTYVMDANRNFTVFDAGNVRAQYAYNFENGSYSCTAFYLYGTDANRFQNKEEFYQFLVALGFEDQLQYTTAKEGSTPGDLQYEELKTVAWLDTAYSTIMSGTNHSIMINFANPGGASLTVMENGKPQLVYGPEGTVITEYAYHNGFLSYIENIAYEIDEYPTEGEEALKEAGLLKEEGAVYSEEDKQNLTEAVKNQTDGKVTWKKSYTRTYMNAYGQYSHEQDAYGNILKTYEYAANGGMLSMLDKTTNATTFFIRGQFSYSTNEKGYITGKAFYNPDGSMLGMESYNDGVATSRTAYYFGQAVGTIGLSSGQPLSFTGIIDAYMEITKPGKTVEEIQSLIAAYNFTSIPVYAGQLANTALLQAAGLVTAVEEQKLKDQLNELIGSESMPEGLEEALENYENAGVGISDPAAAQEARTAAFNALLTYLRDKVASGEIKGELATLINNLKDLSAEEIADYMKDILRYQELKTKQEKLKKDSKDLSTDTNSKGESIYQANEDGTLSDKKKEGADGISESEEFANLSNSEAITGNIAVSVNISRLGQIFDSLKSLTPKHIARQVADINLARQLMFKNNGHSMVANLSFSQGKTHEEKVISDETTTSTSDQHVGGRQTVGTGADTQYDEESGVGSVERTTTQTQTTVIETTVKDV
ncbi:MAG: hypothetical protein LBQ13_00520, partial [Endomicrobium sp.]|nr:hypothetical protein [Endomicrobium sp.]